VCVYTHRTHTCTCIHVPYVCSEPKNNDESIFPFFVGRGAVKRQKSLPPVPLTTQIEPNGALTRRPAGRRVLMFGQIG